MPKQIQSHQVNNYKMPPCIIDDEDYEIISKFNWKFIQSGKTGYYKRGTTKTSVSMHIMIVKDLMKQKIPKGYHVHHIDGNGLNNQRNNLSIVSARENRYAMDRSTYSSQYPSIFQSSTTNKWGFAIFENKMVYKKESFTTEKEAAIARNYVINLKKLNIPLLDILFTQEELDQAITSLNSTWIKNKHKYITYNGFTYLVWIKNKHFKFYQRYKTEKEALAARDEIIKKFQLEDKISLKRHEYKLT